MPDDIDHELHLVRDRILDELIEIDLAVARLVDRRAGLVTTLKGLDDVLGVEGDRPKGYKAVEIVAREAIEEGNAEDRDGALTVGEIVEELRRRGWMPESKNPESAVRAAIRRLREASPRWGLVNGRLYYHDFLHPEDMDEDEEDAGGDEETF